MTTNGIPLFLNDGFTISGTGYYARHLESHRLLYGKRDWVRPALFAAAVLMLIMAFAFNVPGIAMVGVTVLLVLGLAGMKKRNRSEKKGRGKGAAGKDLPAADAD